MFDLEAVAKFGDITVSLSEIRKTIKKREQYIKLADGTMGKIPKEWIEKYKHIFELGVETENGCVLRKHK